LVKVGLTDIGFVSGITEVQLGEMWRFIKRKHAHQNILQRVKIQLFDVNNEFNFA